MNSVSDQYIPFSKPSLGEEEIEAVARVMRSGWLAAGTETAAFEQEFSDYISPPGENYYCIFTNSCTSALKMGYKWFKENRRDHYRVMTPNTFCATYSAAEEMGLMDAQYETWNPSEDEVIHVATHYGGVKYEEEIDIDLEDSAHRIEPNDPLIGKIRCYSFYATKNMTTGSGGMFVTNEREIYDRARLYWRDGLSTSTADRLNGRAEYQVQAMAGGYDGNDIAASIGRVQLRRLPSFTQSRNKIVQRYNGEFGQDWKGNHLYPKFVKDDQEAYAMIDYLKEQGIMTGYHYPGTGWNGVSLPLYPDLTDEEVDYIIATVKSYGGI